MIAHSSPVTITLLCHSYSLQLLLIFLKMHHFSIFLAKLCGCINMLTGVVVGVVWSAGETGRGKGEGCTGECTECSTL